MSKELEEYIEEGCLKHAKDKWGYNPPDNLSVEEKQFNEEILEEVRINYKQGFNDAKVEQFQGFIYNNYEVDCMMPEAVLIYRAKDRHKNNKNPNNWLLFDEVYLIFLKQS